METAWKPVTYKEINMLLEQEATCCNENSLSLWCAIRLPEPELWVQHPWGNEGCGFWVVATAGRTCIYYNDITRGFASGSFHKWGAIADYQPSAANLCDILDEILNDSMNSVELTCV